MPLNNTLPSFDEFIQNTFANNLVNPTVLYHHQNNNQPGFTHVNPATAAVSTSSNRQLYIPSSVTEQTSVGQMKQSLKRTSPVDEFNRLNAEIERQQSEISRLVQENVLLKRKKRKVDTQSNSTQPTNSPQPSHTSSRASSSPIEFTVIAESSLSHNKQDIVMSNVNDYSVVWNGATYVISNIFTNKDDVSHFYCPKFESFYPKKDYKLVVEKNEYRQLLSENPHIIPLFKKRAWRVSLFTMEFVNFVRECNQNGNN
ncbi:predicted protein [Naegleria gruberi]|uniref:Predicted protein n=1 Tax=Naegleria gruberi TaxID=5762 RepID=D2VXI2_NAEGR|nr:uncharacterized protein NAEGRDRAFT_73756 [Naegleria gruberi]EFC38513.1 predicted protein [Naegleria gruberi]|eukprot:XP_002671257.1 predicted protein [Naegleria gruberi strain NEG-M]